MKETPLKQASGITGIPAQANFFSDAVSSSEVHRLLDVVEREKFANTTTGCSRWSPIIPAQTDPSSHGH